MELHKTWRHRLSLYPKDKRRRHHRWRICRQPDCHHRASKHSHRQDTHPCPPHTLINQLKGAVSTCYQLKGSRRCLYMSRSFHRRCSKCRLDACRCCHRKRGKRRQFAARCYRQKAGSERRFGSRDVAGSRRLRRRQEREKIRQDERHHPVAFRRCQRNCSSPRRATSSIPCTACRRQECRSSPSDRRRQGFPAAIGGHHRLLDRRGMLPRLRQNRTIRRREGERFSTSRCPCLLLYISTVETW